MTTSSNPAVPPAPAPAAGPGTPPAQPAVPPNPGQPPAQGSPAPPADAGDQGQQPTAQQGQQGDPSQLGDAGQRALKAERDARAAAERARKAAEDKLAAIERQNMSEADKAKAEAADWQRRYQEAEAERLRAAVAVRHRVSADDMILLTGTTEDQLEAQAARLSQLTAGQGGATPPAPAFAPNPGQAAGNATPPKTATVQAGRDLYRQKHPGKQPTA